MATKRTAAPKAAKESVSAEPAKCRPCGGTGTVAAMVRVGRKRRPVGQQDGLCLNCFGTGTDPES
ncbi:hypothetical protein ACWFRK_32790 [Streptomyces sp. NPDC055157]